MLPADSPYLVRIPEPEEAILSAGDAVITISIEANSEDRSRVALQDVQLLRGQVLHDENFSKIFVSKCTIFVFVARRTFAG